MARIGDWLRGRQTSGHRLDGHGLRPDLLAAATQMVTDARSDPFVVGLEPLLGESETVLRLLEGRHDHEMGLLVLTSERLFFRANKNPGRPEVDLALTAVAGVEAYAGRTSGGVRIRTMDLVHVVDQILGTQGDALAASVQSSAGLRPAEVRDPIQLLAELRALRDAGAISPDEFEIRKAALWDQL